MSDQPRDGMPRAYLRIDPNLDQTHPDPLGMLLVLCAAARQPERGRFRDRALLVRAVGARRAQRFLERGDVVQLPDGRFYVDGWDEWQEGDWTVAERMKRMRHRRVEKRKGYGGSVTADTVAASPSRTDVTTDAGIDNPPSDYLSGDGGGGGGARAREDDRPQGPDEPGETAGQLPGNLGETSGKPFPSEPERPALIWLAEHRATLDPNGNGLHRDLAALVEHHGSGPVLAAFEELSADPKTHTARQFIYGAVNRLDRIPAAPRAKEAEAAEREAEREQARRNRKPDPLLAEIAAKSIEVYGDGERYAPGRSEQSA